MRLRFSNWVIRELEYPNITKDICVNESNSLTTSSGSDKGGTLTG